MEALSTDGLSIPFFTLSRRVHSRTISLSRTLTSRQTNLGPDWLLSTRRVTERSKDATSDVEQGAGVSQVSAAGDGQPVSEVDGQHGLGEHLANSPDVMLVDREEAAGRNTMHSDFVVEGVEPEDGDRDVPSRSAQFVEVSGRVCHQLFTPAPEI